MDKYRKLTAKDMETYGLKLNQKQSHKDFAALVTKHFGEKANRILIGFNSEYNDEGYDIHGASYVEVYDKNDNMLTPNKSMIESWRKTISNMDCTGLLYDEYPDYIEESPDDLVIFIKDSVPELYVKDTQTP